jgi:DNA mismatch repair protein MutS
MALIKEYFELTKKYQEEYGENTLLLMQVGSFFEVYAIRDKKTNSISGSKICDFSLTCELNMVDKNVCVGKDNVLMAGFKDIMIEKYLRKMQDSGFTVVVYTQDQAAKNTSRSCAGIFSPGTYFSSEPTRLTNNLTCIWVDLIENKVLLKGKYVLVGIANIDVYTGKTSIFQFKEAYLKNPTTYDELERFISIYHPNEVIFISNLPTSEVDDIINFANITSRSIHKINIGISCEKESKNYIRAKNCEKQNYQKEILHKFYELTDSDIFIQNFYDNHIATQAFCYLLDFVYQHNPQLVKRISEPIFENCSDRLILANHTLKQLNMIDDSNYHGKHSSVLKMLNECLTPMGKRKFAYNLVNPTTNKDYLQREYNITEYLMKKEDDYHLFLKTNLSSIKDISKWERQVFLKKITPKSFYHLHHNILIIKEIYKNSIQDDGVIKDYLLKSEKEETIKKIDAYCDNITKFINDNINLDLAKDIDTIQNFETNFINLGVDKELDFKIEILNDSEGKLEAIKNYLNSLIHDKGKTSEFVKIYETEKNNFTLICTSRRCKLLEESLPSTKQKIILEYSSNGKNDKKQFEYEISKKQLEYKNQTASNNCILDYEIKQICKNISTSKILLKDIITIVYNKFVEKFETFQNELESIIQFITSIDIIFTKASIAKKYNYCKPQIVEADKSFINVKNLRHCLIENLQTNELYVTNDMKIGDGIVDGVLLYGTNAVGKTSFIRALGISLIMAQSGLFVPSSEFIFKPYNYIFSRILGNDNIFKGLSTFAVEMSELRTILRLADKNSLILGDELCSGTENTSAISIFVAGIQKLFSCKSSFIFATHLHEICSYDEICDLKSVVLKHMEVIYDKEKDVLIYDRKLKDGPGNSMYGLEVCKSLSLPEDFLRAAYEIRMKYHPETNSILSLKTSHYNSKKIMNLCEICNKKIGTEVHHLQHQKNADKDGFIKGGDGGIFNKNNLANLLTLCEDCHHSFHKKESKITKKVKTSNGYQIQEI